VSPADCAEPSAPTPPPSPPPIEVIDENTELIPLTPEGPPAPTFTSKFVLKRTVRGVSVEPPPPEVSVEKELL